jgi:hypothetical protein
VTSWRRIAEAGTVTSHHCDILLTALAQASAGEVSAGLLRAAASARTARSVWLRTARDLNQVTTETRRHVSQAAVEAADLALWTGRLGYAEPDWDLASGPSYFRSRRPRVQIPASRPGQTISKARPLRFAPPALTRRVAMLQRVPPGSAIKVRASLAHAGLVRHPPGQGAPQRDRRQRAVLRPVLRQRSRSRAGGRLRRRACAQRR